MSSYNRRVFLFSAAALVGCGFEPALAPGGNADVIRGRIRAADPKNRNDFNFVNRFEDRNGSATRADYTLTYVIQTRSVGLAVTQAQVTTRFNLTGTARFAVADAASGAILSQGSVENFTSYSATGTTVASLAAERDANDRLMTILADQVLARLTATSGSWAS